MRTHIDWITFTAPVIYGTGENDDYEMAVQAGLVALLENDMVEALFAGLRRDGGKKRAPYTDVWVDADGGISLFASPNLTHCCVEISGRGCEAIIEAGTMARLMGLVRETVTRVDVATDIETGIPPTEFVFYTNHERMRASGYQKSETGETCYVGSKKSDRYARVYRYNEPHPRSHLLRVEHVFRRDYAKSVARAIVGATVEDVATEAGKAFGWAHGVWQPNANQEVDISISSPERNAGTTVAWLVKSVAPAIRRLIADGTIRDADAFFDAYFRPE